MGGTESVANLYFETKDLSTKQWVEPESTRALTSRNFKLGKIKLTNKELRLERADMLRR